jgi:hypothetical protein
MSVRLLIAILSMVAVAMLAAPAPAQEATAEVRTWSGQAWGLSQPYLEVFYTIIPPSKDGGAPAAAPAAGGGGYGSGMAAGGGSSQAMFFGSVKDLSSLVGPLGPQPFEGRSRVETLLFVRDGVETRLPVEKISTLAFARQPVADSTLPPYVAGTHFRYGAAAVTTDGARLDADYVNLGTMVLRGMTPQGRVDIPWGDIETVRFKW